MRLCCVKLKLFTERDKCFSAPRTIADRVGKQNTLLGRRELAFEIKMF